MGGLMYSTAAVKSPGISRESLALSALVMTTVLWAAAFIAGKVVLRELDPMAAGALRHAIAGLSMVPLAIRYRPTFAQLRSAAGPLSVMIVSSGLLYPWLFLEALNTTDTTNCSLLIALNPLFTVILSPLVGEHRLRDWRGVAVAVFGAALVITRGDIYQLAKLSGARGDLLALAAAGVWSMFNLASRGVVHKLHASVVNVCVYGIGGTTLLLLIRDQHPLAQLAGLSSSALYSLLFMGVIASAFAGQLFLYGVRVVGVNRTVVFIYLVPVLTAILSSVILDETLVAAQIIGGIAVLAGVYWSSARA